MEVKWAKNNATGWKFKTRDNHNFNAEKSIFK